MDVGETIQLFVPVAMRSQMAPNYLGRNVNNRRAAGFMCSAVSNRESPRSRRSRACSRSIDR